MPSQYEKVLIMGRRVKHIIEKAELSAYLSEKPQEHRHFMSLSPIIVTKEVC
jgi:sulfopyruvate decarboxylase TPP-binding subunit